MCFSALALALIIALLPAGLYLKTSNCARLLIVVIPVLKAAVKSTKVKSHDTNVHDVTIVHVITGDTQTN